MFFKAVPVADADAGHTELLKHGVDLGLEVHRDGRSRLVEEGHGGPVVEQAKENKALGLA